MPMALNDLRAPAPVPALAAAMTVDGASAPGLAIMGIGTAVPPLTVDQATAAAMSARIRGLNPHQARREKLLYRSTGVARRHLVVLEDAGGTRRSSFYEPAVVADRSADPGTVAAPSPSPGTGARMVRYAREAPALAEVACRRALTAAGVTPEQITHLVVVTCTGFAAPGVDVALIGRLGLPPTVERVQVGFMGCHGMINGMRVAEGLARARADARVLVCAVELCSLHFQFDASADSTVANALFADGAAALVACTIRPMGKGELRPPTHAVELRATGSCVVPDSTQVMQWLIGDHGFAMKLGAQVPTRIADELPGWLNGWLAKQGETVDSIAGWVVHPGGPRVLDAVRSALGLEEVALAASRGVLSDFGNMSSPTLLFILERMQAQAVTGPCVLLAFGPGLTMEAALVVLH